MLRGNTTARFDRQMNVALLLAALLLFVTLAGPAAGGDKKDKKQPAAPAAAPAAKKVDTSALVWPSPPDVARIKWVTQVSGQDDLAPPPPEKPKKKSWMDRLAGVSLPEETRKKNPSLAKPFGVAADSKGRIYAADTARSAVFVFDLESKKVVFLPGKFAVPIAVTLDDADRVFVVDTKLRQVSAFTPGWELEATFGEEQLERPVGIAVDNENRFLYVVDAKANRLAVYDADKFQFLRFLGQPSNPLDPQPGTFSIPLGVAVDADGNVYVTDTMNDRVQMFDADGNFVVMFGKQGVTPGTFMRAKGIAVDSDGHIFVTDAEFNNVQVFDKEGRTLGVFGTRGTEPGEFSLITGIYIDSKNLVYVTDQWKARVQVFRYVTDAEAQAESEARFNLQKQAGAPAAKSSAPPK